MKPNLTPQEEVEAVGIYLELHHRGKTLDQLPEKTLAGLFNQLSPAARGILKQHQEVAQDFRDSGGRQMPFEPKRSIDDLNLPAHTKAILEKADTESVVQGLNERMHTPTEVESGPPDRRETLAAAFDAHSQQEQ